MIAGSAPFYTYLHRRADDGKVFYVGKGKGKRADSRDGRNPWWRAVAEKHGVDVSIAATWDNEESAFRHEIFLIKRMRELGQPLCNLTDGGDGASGRKHSNESKKLISEKNSGRKRTKEQNKRNSEARKGRHLPPEVCEKIRFANKGQKRSDQARANISAGSIGKTISEDQRLKISAANKGLVRSEAARARISEALTGRPVSDMTRQKISESNSGKKVSESTKAKISKTLTGRKHSKVTMEKLILIAASPDRRAKQSKAMKGRPWSEARRAAQLRRAAP